MTVFGLIAATLVTLKSYWLAQDCHLLAAALPFSFGLCCMGVFIALIALGV